MVNDKDSLNLLPRLFINSYANSNYQSVTREVDRMSILMGNPKEPQRVRVAVYNLMVENHRRGNDYIRGLIEDALVDTENHPSVSPDKRPFNIVGVDLSVVPASAINSVNMHKLALLPSSFEHDVTVDPEFPDCDNFVYHHGSTPELIATARAFLKQLQFEV